MGIILKAPTLAFLLGITQQTLADSKSDLPNEDETILQLTKTLANLTESAENAVISELSDLEEQSYRVINSLFASTLPTTSHQAKVNVIRGRFRTFPLSHSGLAYNLFPNEHRLAELIGLGTNAVSLNYTHVDPKLRSRFPYGREVVSRIQADLIGHLQLHSGERIPSFHWQLLSTNYYPSIAINYGPDVKPHHFGIEDLVAQSAIEKHAPQHQPWMLEKMADRIRQEGKALPPTAAATEAQHPEPIELERLLQLKLEEPRMKVVALLSSDERFAQTIRQLAAYDQLWNEALVPIFPDLTTTRAYAEWYIETLIERKLSAYDFSTKLASNLRARSLFNALIGDQPLGSNPDLKQLTQILEFK